MGWLVFFLVMVGWYAIGVSAYLYYRSTYGTIPLGSDDILIAAFVGFIGPFAMKVGQDIYEHEINNAVREKCVEEIEKRRKEQQHNDMIKPDPWKRPPRKNKGKFDL